MKTLREHNQEVKERAAEVPSRQPTGYACNGCGTETLYREPKQMNFGGSPSYWVYCPGCGKADLVY